MNFSAKLQGLDGIADGMRDLGNSLSASATDAAAAALADTVDEARKAEGLNAPLARTGGGARHEIHANDPDSIAREFGTLETDPSPWLAPLLPAAQGPMRAVIATVAARAISALRLKP